MSDTTTVAVVDEDLDDFRKRLADKRHRTDIVSKFHIELYLNRGVELPYTTDDTWVFCTQYQKDINGDDIYEGEGTDRHRIIDVPATEAVLRNITQYARSKKYPVTKKYDDNNFELFVWLEGKPDDWRNLKIKYSADRKVVCRKVYTGEKIVHPAETKPEWIEEVSEWECEKVSFLADDNEE